jgi:hypothetical protein
MVIARLTGPSLKPKTVTGDSAVGTPMKQAPVMPSRPAAPGAKPAPATKKP